jgi:serine/threonine protein kinase
METGNTDIVMDPVHETACLKCQHLMDVSNLPAFVEIACPECGTKQHVPAKIGVFMLVDLLGKGGMGAVYRGRDTGLDRWVAVKVMQSTFGGNPEFVETFRREAQAAAALNHPNIVQIYSFGVAHGQPYLAMELLDGGRMDQMIAAGEPLNEALVLKMMIDVAEGLNAAAAINLIHGDVKPENILLDNNGIAKVVDFGLARFKESSDGGASKGIWGTPYYIAPEKLRGHPSDARSDIYSLGGTLFHALTLKPPFDGETPMDVVKARLKNPAPLLRTLCPDASPELEALVARMLEAEPLKRYPNYASVLADMRRILPTLKPVAAPAFGQLSKKGSKIILAKKKGSAPGGTTVTPMSVTGLKVTKGAQAGSPAVAVSPDAAPKSSNRGKIIVGVVLGLMILVGGITAIVVHQKNKSVEEKEKELAAKYRKKAGQIWTELQTVIVDASNHGVKAQTWLSNATETVKYITEGPLAPEESDRTNALANLEIVQGYVTGMLASASVELKGLNDLVASTQQGILSHSNSAVMLEKLGLITNAPVKSKDVVLLLMPETDKTRKAMENLEALRKKLDKAIRAKAAADAQAALEKAEADKLEAERLAKEKVVAEKKAAIQAELDQLDAARKETGTLVQQHLFKEVLASVEKVAKTLRTEEGKVAGRNTIKAYEMLVELKTLFIDGIKEDVKANPDSGYGFGWLGNKDILGVDENKILIRGAEIPWAMVPPQQIMRFVQRYVENGSLTRRDKARANLALALYIYEASGRDEKQNDRVSKYLNEAVRSHKSVEDIASAVLPNIEIK